MPPGNLTRLSQGFWWPGCPEFIRPSPVVRPSLFIESTATNTLVCSWPFSVALFGVQQSSDLTSTNWITLTNLPSFAGIRNRVVLPMPPQRMFYRLAKN
jgi:hypothetical protein